MKSFSTRVSRCMSKWCGFAFRIGTQPSETLKFFHFVQSRLDLRFQQFYLQISAIRRFMFKYLSGFPSVKNNGIQKTPVFHFKKYKYLKACSVNTKHAVLKDNSNIAISLLLWTISFDVVIYFGCYGSLLLWLRQILICVSLFGKCWLFCPSMERMSRNTWHDVYLFQP